MMNDMRSSNNQSAILLSALSYGRAVDDRPHIPDLPVGE